MGFPFGLIAAAVHKFSVSVEFPKNSFHNCAVSGFSGGRGIVYPTKRLLGVAAVLSFGGFGKLVNLFAVFRVMFVVVFFSNRLVNGRGNLL